jgi:hypothetical protein
MMRVLYLKLHLWISKNLFIQKVSVIQDMSDSCKKQN